MGVGMANGPKAVWTTGSMTRPFVTRPGMLLFASLSSRIGHCLGGAALIERKGADVSLLTARLATGCVEVVLPAACTLPAAAAPAPPRRDMLIRPPVAALDDAPDLMVSVPRYVAI